MFCIGHWVSLSKKHSRIGVFHSTTTQNFQQQSIFFPETCLFSLQDVYIVKMIVKKNFLMLCFWVTVLLCAGINHNSILSWENALLCYKISWNWVSMSFSVMLTLFFTQILGNYRFKKIIIFISLQLFNWHFLMQRLYIKLFNLKNVWDGCTNGHVLSCLSATTQRWILLCPSL